MAMLSSVLEEEVRIENELHDDILETVIIPPLPNEFDADNSSPIVLFARSLKIIHPRTFIITSFDEAAFKAKCQKISPEYDSQMDMSVIAKELFKKDEVWINKDVLNDCVSIFANSIGCKSVKTRDLIKVKSRNPSMESDESFRIKLRALYNEKKSAASPKDPTKSIAKARPVWDREVQIKEVCCDLPIGPLLREKRSADDGYDPSCPSATFAHSLKVLDTISMTIISFDEKSFQSKCLRYIPSDDDNDPLKSNPDFDKNLNMDLMAQELFKKNDVWLSREVLFQALSSFANVFGFKMIKTRNLLLCKRYGADSGQRNWSEGPWKVGCPFCITLKALHTARRLSKNPKDPSNIIPPKARPVWGREVLIKTAHCVHGGGCNPGQEIVIPAKKLPKASHPNINVLKSPSLINLFTKIRDKKSDTDTFIKYSKRIMRLLAEETLAKLPSKSHTVMTPTNEHYYGQLSIVDTHPDYVCIVSVIRAGDALLDSFREIAPSVRVGKLWIQRNEESSTKEAVHSCTKLPDNMHEMKAVILCDPMLATGGSSLAALNVLVNQFRVLPERIIFSNLICCPEGLDFLMKEHPEVTIVTCWIDEKLNDNKYILPGLGDFGDRFYNTVPRT